MVGIEGTGSYGAGIARRLVELGYDVVEVVRPKRDKRRAGLDKNDPVDAERAVRDALAGKASGAPKAGTGWVEALRFRMIAREAAVAESTRVANSTHALIVTAPDPVREKLGGMGTAALMRVLSRKHKTHDEFERSRRITSYVLEFYNLRLGVLQVVFSELFLGFYNLVHAAVLSLALSS